MTFHPQQAGNRNKRRRAKDPLIKILTWANGIAAIGLFAAICVAAIAKPEPVTFFDRFYNVNVYRRPHWDMLLVDYIALLLALSGIVSIIGLIINSQRLKRKGDFVRATLVICLTMSIAGLGLYFFHT